MSAIACQRQQSPPPTQLDAGGGRGPAAAPQSPPIAVDDPPPQAEPPKLQAEPAKPQDLTIDQIAEDLAIAWYDARLTEPRLVLLCDSSASWIEADLDGRTSCAEDGTVVHVIDESGSTPWTVRARERKGGFADPEFVREDAQYPDVSKPLLVAKAEPAEGRRLEPATTSAPSKATSSIRPTVAAAIAALDDESDVEGSQLRAVASIRGDFGGGSDEVVVFEVRDPDSDYEGHQVLAAMASGRFVGLYGTEPLQWAGHQLVGATDLDADGTQELLWWARSEGVGVGLVFAYHANGTHAQRTLFSCQCGGAFDDAYPRRRRK